jgi:hypothetical protein
MFSGAVAIIDALGFRGIWERHLPDDVLGAMKALKAKLENRIAAQFTSQPWMQCEIAFLSDTIALSMALDPSTKNRMAMSVLYLSDVISWVLEETLRSTIPLAYRGAIALGDYDISPHFLIGKAIDEAAGVHDLADGAFIWLTPQARDEVASWLKDQPHNTHMVKFDVPLKGGNLFHTYTVSPFEQAHNQEDADGLALSLLSSMKGSRMDIAIKRQNTARHLAACYEWRNFKAPISLATL